MRTIHRRIVAAVVLSADQKLLMGKQRPGGVYMDVWHIPGGGIDGDETPEQALQRELREEVGLDINQDQMELLDDLGHGRAQKTLKNGEQVQVEMDFLVYRVQLPELAVQVPVQLNDDLVEFTWADLKQLAEYPLTPPSQVLFKRLGWIPK